MSTYPFSASSDTPHYPMQTEEIVDDMYQRQVPHNRRQREDPLDPERESLLAGLHPSVQRRMLNAAREINNGQVA